MNTSPTKKSSAHGELKANIMISTLTAAMRSRFCYLLLLLIISAVSVNVYSIWITMLLPVGFFLVYWKSLLFEIILLEHLFEQFIGTFKWDSFADENLYLGAVPLQHQDLHRLAKKEGIDAVLSIVEPFEQQLMTLGGTPVTPEQWAANGIAQLSLPSPDFFPPPFNILDQGAAFIDRHLSDGRKVYCHCKSGRGRSASVVMAYFMKYKKLDVVTAFSRLKTRRPLIFEQNSSQMRNMISYAEHIKSPGSNMYHMKNSS